MGKNASDVHSEVYGPGTTASGYYFGTDTELKVSSFVHRRLDENQNENKNDYIGFCQDGWYVNCKGEANRACFYYWRNLAGSFKVISGPKRKNISSRLRLVLEDETSIDTNTSTYKQITEEHKYGIQIDNPSQKYMPEYTRVFQMFKIRKEAKMTKINPSINGTLARIVCVPYVRNTVCDDDAVIHCVQDDELLTQAYERPENEPSAVRTYDGGYIYVKRVGMRLMILNGEECAQISNLGVFSMFDAIPLDFSEFFPHESPVIEEKKKKARVEDPFYDLGEYFMSKEHTSVKDRVEADHNSLTDQIVCTALAARGVNVGDVPLVTDPSVLVGVNKEKLYSVKKALIASLYN